MQTRALISSMLALFITGCASTSGPPENATHMRFQIQGLRNSGKVATLKENLKFLRGVRRVAVDGPSETVELSTDSRCPLTFVQLQSTLKKTSAGFSIRNSTMTFRGTIQINASGKEASPIMDSLRSIESVIQVIELLRAGWYELVIGTKRTVGLTAIERALKSSGSRLQDVAFEWTPVKVTERPEGHQHTGAG